jgi:hypothetical protein
MGEWSDQWNSEKKKNIWGAVPDVVEMQSEGGAAQNPDVFFQAREACNPFYRACPTIVQDAMDRFANELAGSID